MENNFCIFIISHGRPNDIITLKTLQKAGCVLPIFIVIDNHDKTADDYLEKYPCSDLMNKELIQQFRKYINFYTTNLNLNIIEKYNIGTVNDNSLFNKGIYEI